MHGLRHDFGPDIAEPKLGDTGGQGNPPDIFDQSKIAVVNRYRYSFLVGQCGG